MTQLSLDIAHDLTTAVVSSSTVPLLLLAGDQLVLTASRSFCETYSIDPTKVVGRSIFSLGDGEWNVPQLRTLLEGVASGTVSVPSYEMDLKRAGHASRHLVLNPQKLEYSESKNTRVVLSIVDVTDSRLNEKFRSALVKENALLLQEIQHRVANSLQIIASILLQSARRVQSDETRGHLKNAHSRVMSLATVQQQLARSQDTHVEVCAYFKQLCKSLSASMITDTEKVSIVIHAEQSFLSSDTATSLGLIITELVINCLKHAFPGNEGKITITFDSQDDGWTLLVEDDGIGMPSGPEKATPGLGTTLIQALAQKLDAQIVVTDAKPGTTVLLSHRKVAAHAQPQLAV
jgi:two-component sensor histidine kinase